jgi:hypothetical protein
VDLDGNYYPLGYGFEWTYEQLESGPFTHFINGKTYYRNENDYSKPIRVENNILYVYERADDQEYVSIDFNKPVGYEWDHYLYDRTYTIISKSATFDTLDNCIVIASESALDYSESTYAPGIGLVRDHLEGRGDVIIICGNIYLRSATINGKTINFGE